MTNKMLPKSVRTKALTAIAAIHAWNAAVHQARQREALDDCIGHYEYDLVTGATDFDLGMAEGQSLHILDLLEQAARAQGMSPQEFYAAVGTERPEVAKEGRRVCEWRVGVR
jgi:ABC-type branched-subunit amino acid transport system substrate-binding protein